MAEIFMKHKELQSENPGKSKELVSETSSSFFKYFILLGMLGSRSPSDTVQKALRVSFLSLDFFAFAAVLDPRCKTRLGQTESSQPLSSSLCCARKNPGALGPRCDRERLGEIGI